MTIIRKVRFAVRTHGPRGKVAAAFVLAAMFVLARCSDAPFSPVSESVTPAGPQGDHVGNPSSAFDDFEFIHPFLEDDGGPNDVPAQSDLNAFTRADNVTGYVGVQIVWDNVAQWTGAGQTGDACALFDTDPSNANKGVGMADYAVCVRITNPNGDGSTTVQLSPPASPVLYSCGDTKADRCASKTTLLTATGIHCEVERIAGEAFFDLGEDNADILATCKIPLATIGTGVTPNLINVCSFPSGSPNSNPFDCVIRAGAGLLKIVKKTTPQNSGQSFTFAVSPTPFTAGPYTISDNSANDEQITLSVAPGNSYSVTETVPATWQLDDASCYRETTPNTTPTGTKDGDAVTGISVTSGETTVCTFENKVVAPSMSVQKTANPTSIPETGGNVTYTVVVTNNSVIPITLDSLIDDTFGDLDGEGTCNSAADPTNPYGSIAANGGTYTCTFTKALGASNTGQTHVNEVTAYASSAGGEVDDSDDATVTYTDVLPDISVVKSADITSIPANGGASPDNFTPDQSFARNGGGGGNGGLSFASSVCDDGGPNDINAAQNDLNCFARADNVPGRLGVGWTWDSTDEWGGGGQTGDGCALLDTDGDGDANFALCVRVSNPSLDPLQVEQAQGSPILYQCNDVGKGGAPDRCAASTTVKPLDASSVCTVSIVSEHFVGEGDDGADVQAECNLRLQDLHQTATNANVDLLNVCSFPSGSPNSNPFDCVVQAGAGFLVITKTTTPTNSDSYFGFRLRNAANSANAFSTHNPPQDEWSVQGGATSAAIPILPGTYALTELLPTNWSLTSISCTRDGSNVGNTSGNTRLNLTIEQGQTTTCVFNNSLSASALVTFTVTVTNNSAEAVNLFSLEDTENPDAGTPTFSTLSGVGTCNGAGNLFGSIAGSGGTYSCTFSRTISGAPGFEHKDRVRAVGKDDENNADTELSNVVTVTITN